METTKSPYENKFIPVDECMRIFNTLKTICDLLKYRISMESYGALVLKGNGLYVAHIYFQGLKCEDITNILISYVAQRIEDHWAKINSNPNLRITSGATGRIVSMWSNCTIDIVMRSDISGEFLYWRNVPMTTDLLEVETYLDNLLPKIMVFYNDKLAMVEEKDATIIENRRIKMEEDRVANEAYQQRKAEERAKAEKAERARIKYEEKRAAKLRIRLNEIAEKERIRKAEVLERRKLKKERDAVNRRELAKKREEEYRTFVENNKDIFAKMREKQEAKEQQYRDTSPTYLMNIILYGSRYGRATLLLDASIKGRLFAIMEDEGYPFGHHETLSKFIRNYFKIQNTEVELEYIQKYKISSKEEKALDHLTLLNGCITSFSSFITTINMKSRTDILSNECFRYMFNIFKNDPLITSGNVDQMHTMVLYRRLQSMQDALACNIRNGIFSFETVEYDFDFYEKIAKFGRI